MVTNKPTPQELKDNDCPPKCNQDWCDDCKFRFTVKIKNKQHGRSNRKRA